MSETENQRQLLETPVGLPGSGATRYAAAMYFFQTGKMSVELLEIYRRCSKFDFEDPLDLAKFEGVEVTDQLCKSQKDTRH